jgi:prepilin-type processing-associated H-X9-DG protein
MVFIEEADYRGWNNGAWEMTVASPYRPESIRTVDPFSVFHGKVGTFVFADGHSETHKWVSKGILDNALLAASGQNTTSYRHPLRGEPPIYPNILADDGRFLHNAFRHRFWIPW